jgi:hypothetical protein
VQQFIRIVLSEDWAHSAAGQIIAECLVNLLVRQVGLVEQLEVVAAPDAPLLIRPIFKGDWQTLSDYLAAMGEWAVVTTLVKSKAKQCVYPKRDALDVRVCNALGAIHR